jgi:hypothetical protein
MFEIIGISFWLKGMGFKVQVLGYRVHLWKYTGAVLNPKP